MVDKIKKLIVSDNKVEMVVKLFLLALSVAILIRICSFIVSVLIDAILITVPIVIVFCVGYAIYKHFQESSDKE